MNGIDSVSGGMQYNPVQRAREKSVEDPENEEKKSAFANMEVDTVDISEEARKMSEEKQKLDEEKQKMEEEKKALEEQAKADEAKNSEDPEGKIGWAVTEIEGDPTDPSSLRRHAVAKGDGAIPPGYGA